MTYPTNHGRLISDQLEKGLRELQTVAPYDYAAAYSHTLATGADDLDRLTARWLPVESRRVLAAEEIHARIIRDLWQAGAHAGMFGGGRGAA